MYIYLRAFKRKRKSFLLWKNGRANSNLAIFGQKWGENLKISKISAPLFSTPKDSNLTKYWVYSINRAQINWWKAFFWFRLPDPWFLVRIDKNLSFFENVWKNMYIPSKKLLFFHTYHITTTFEGYQSSKIGIFETQNLYKHV